ncbi:LacI family DNA-binding transcriptional regulator [Actinomycetaceae bacterium MB13-C1-2]|nr:LacI family DNA-binding transcriptional regulator [Actinomycetaceae bacterium MB13-C1-2]
MATIYDVARLAKVSPATVSRVFNGIGASKEKTDAVRKAAKELRFTPNRSARSLRRQKSEILTLVIPDIENPYFTEVARGVEDVAQEAGYSLMLCNTDGDPEKEERYLQVAISEHIAGVIIACAGPMTNLDDALAAGRQIVAVDRGSSYDIDEVIMANTKAGRVATEDLVRKGCKRIACITGPRELDTAYERAEGWKAVMGQHFPDLDLDPLLHYSTFRVADGRRCAELLMAMPEPPDAIVAANNLLGVGAIQVLSEMGMAPPKIGVSVIGTLPFTTLSPSAVTVVRLPGRQMGETAAKMLLERISGDRQPARTVVLRNEVKSAGRPINGTSG